MSAEAVPSRWSRLAQPLRASPVARWALRHALLLPVVLLAAWLRLHNLASEHVFGDEAEYAIVARYLAEDPLALFYPALSYGQEQVFVSQPPLLLYLMSVSILAFGANAFAAILPSALLGTATVVAAYALGWRLGGRLPALVAAALLAILPFHVEWSRTAMLDVGYAFFLLLAAYFLVAWLQDRRARQAVGAGLAAAGAALSKLPGVLVGPVMVAALLVALAPLAVRLVRERRPDAVAPEATRILRHAALAALPIAVGAAAYVGLLHAVDAFDALQDKLQWNYERVAEGSSGTKGVEYYFTDERSSFQAQLGAGIFGLALAGAALELARFAWRPAREPARVVLPLLAGVLAAFFLFSDRKVGFYLIPFGPLAAMFVALLAANVRDLVQWAGVRVTRQDLRRAAPVATAFALVLVAMPGYAAFDESYREYGPAHEPRTYGSGFDEAAAWIHERDPEAAQWGTLLGRFSLQFYNGHVTYDQFRSDEAMDRAVAAGELRFVVHDTYLEVPKDEAIVERLVAEHDGRLVHSVERGWARVDVYELRAS